MFGAPSILVESAPSGARLTLGGAWTIAGGGLLETAAKDLVAKAQANAPVVIDMRHVEGLDTAGAWVINRARANLTALGVAVDLEGARTEHAILLHAAHYREAHTIEPHRNALVSVLADIGRASYATVGDLVGGFAFLGRLIVAAAATAPRPGRWRPTAATYHLEKYSLRSAPIIVLINFLVGGIVAQQGIFQLARFGAPQFVVDLVGVLVLRELGVLLTAIMIAGRCGSAITAEIGAMKMREEVDALVVMALDPVETLVLPRVSALIVAMPLLTFLADMAALMGGLVVSAVYGGLTPDVFMVRLQAAIGLNTFLVGLIKSPFMALVIGLIATAEGFAVGGSAESLGQKVTDSVVKSIFMVIVADGIFAMLFAMVRF